MPSKNLNRLPVYLSNDELAALEEIAKDWGTSKSGAIKEALNAVLYTKWQKPNIRTNWAAYRKSKQNGEKEEEAATIAESNQRKRGNKKPKAEDLQSEYLGTYEEGRTEAKSIYEKAKANGKTLDQIQEQNAVLFDERGGEWRRGFADQFRELEEADGEAKATKPKPSKAKKQTARKLPSEAKTAEEIEKAIQTLTATKKTYFALFQRGEIDKATLYKQDRIITDQLNQYLALKRTKAEQEGETPAQTFDKAKAAENAETTKAADKRNAEIDEKLKRLRESYEAGQISAADYDRKAKELEDERPF